jgi:hypothetical protein
MIFLLATVSNSETALRTATEFAGGCEGDSLLTLRTGRLAPPEGLVPTEDKESLAQRLCHHHNQRPTTSATIDFIASMPTIAIAPERAARLRGLGP